MRFHMTMFDYTNDGNVHADVGVCIDETPKKVGFGVIENNISNKYPQKCHIWEC
jgi:hypothetical protein